MFELNDLCCYCFTPKKPLQTLCPHCNIDEKSYYPHPLYLKSTTLLNNQYLIGKVLGQGGFGITYLGLDIHLKKTVAIKEYLPTTLAGREENFVIPLKNQQSNFQKGLNSFLEEARHLAKFNHPNIVRVLNYFEEHHTGYMVMEYINGENPATLLKQHGGVLTIEQTLAILLPILDALETIHAQHLFHLDISAHNILIDQNNTPILIDFGAARSMNLILEQTRTLTLVLKPGYSPPEQYSGTGHIGAWTDIYACGALFYFLLSEKLPPAATDRWQTDNLPILKVEPFINQAIKKSLQLKIEQRFQHISDFRRAISEQPTSKKPFIFSLISLFLMGIYFIWYFSFTNTTYFYELPMLESPLLAENNSSNLSPPLESTNISELPVKISNQLQIENYLKIAQQQLANLKLTNPLNDNAYQTYLILKKIAPTDQRVEEIVEKIADAYLKLAQQPNNIEKKQQLIEKGLEIAPQHNGLKTLQTTLQEKPLQKLPETELFLTEAQRFQQNGQLEEAAKKYQKILLYQPDHKIAQQSLKQIAQQFAKQAEQSNAPADALLWITKALQLQPNQPAFLALQDKISDQLNQPVEIIKEVIKEVEVQKSIEKPQISPLPEKPKPPLLVTPSF
ncbi:MAG: hypothetical protein RIT27_570 [Pseudomonadota bacterium]|jgi:serine/threonine protein kinase